MKIDHYAVVSSKEEKINEDIIEWGGKRYKKIHSRSFEETLITTSTEEPLTQTVTGNFDIRNQERSIIWAWVKAIVYIITVAIIVYKLKYM